MLNPLKGHSCTLKELLLLRHSPIMLQTQKLTALCAQSSPKN